LDSLSQIIAALFNTMISMLIIFGELSKVRISMPFWVLFLES
jgi:hypothetical protein